MKKTILSDEVLKSLSGVDLTEILYEIDNMALAIQDKKTVDAWLNEVSYAPDPSYVPSEFALKYIAFMKLCDGTVGSDNLTPIIHLKLLDSFASGYDRIANLLFRGAGKTTLIQYLFPYLAVFRDFPGFGEIDYAIYISDSIDNGVASFRDSMKAIWDRSAFLQRMLPERIDGKVVTFFNATRWQMTNQKGETLVVRGYGVKTGVRGSKSKGRRPQLAVIDDVISDEDAESDVLIQKINNTIDKAITHALDPMRVLIWLGTPFNAKDPLYAAVESGAWYVNVFPIAERFPCARAEFRGAWEDRFSYDYLLREFMVAASSGKVSSFNQELLLRIMGENDRLISEEDICYYALATVKDCLENFNVYITTDFAVSDKQHADLSAIGVWAVDHKRRIYYIDGYCGKQTMDKNIDKLFYFAEKYNPIGVGVEASGQQKAFIAWIRKEMEMRDVYFPFAENLTNTRYGRTAQGGNTAGVFTSTNKITALSVVVPWFKRREIFFPTELVGTPALSELLNEIRLVSPSGIRSRYDDMLDMVSQLGKIEIMPSSFYSGNTYDHDEFYEEEGSELEGYIV